MSRISGREVATTEQISTDLISNIIDLTYYNDQETQESGVLTLSLSPKCFWQGQNWRLNCKPGFHPPPPHSSISDQQQPDPHPFPVWAELCTEGASAPRHTSSSPHHPSPAEQLPAAQDSSFLPWGVMAWRARGWSATPRATEEVSAQLPARARDGPQCGSGRRRSLVEGSSVQSNLTDPDCSGAEVHGWTEPRGSGPAHCAASATQWLAKASRGLLENCLILYDKWESF